MPSLRKPKSLPTPHTILETGRGTLRFFLADCLDVFRSLGPASVSAIVTSPPYNLGIRYRSYDDSQPRSRYLKWTAAWIQAATRVLLPHGSLFLNVGAKPTDPWTAMDVAQAVRPHLHLQNTLHWVKSIAIEKEAAGIAADLDRDLAVGHYKPINSNRFVNDCHEFIFHFTPQGRTPLDRLALGVPYQDASNIARWRSGGSNRRCRGNAWFIPYETIQSRDKDRPHPATFPPRIPEYCLRLHGLSRLGLVLDPFLGLGSSAVAAAQLGLEFIGVEMDRHYLEEAVERVRQELRNADARQKAEVRSQKSEGRRQKLRPRSKDGDLFEF
jgi:site-specific DNA-methyltransferase (adenine-specific)